MLTYRMITYNDKDLLFSWINDENVRRASFNSDYINYDTHCKWFESKIQNPDVFIYMFFDSKLNPVGFVRIEKNIEKALISILIDSNHRGKNYAVEMLKKATCSFFEKNSKILIEAYIKSFNKASIQSFVKAGFNFYKNIEISGEESMLFQKRNDYDN